MLFIGDGPSYLFDWADLYVFLPCLTPMLAKNLLNALANTFTGFWMTKSMTCLMVLVIRLFRVGYYFVNTLLVVDETLNDENFQNQMGILV